MNTTVRAMRRGLFATFAVSAAGGVAAAVLAIPSAPSATAAQDPCAASEVAKTIGSVANSTGEYLEEHPQTNQVLTTLAKQQAGPQSLGALKSYFDANPAVAKDMQQLQQPLTSLSGKCNLPLTMPQLLGLMQAAQQNTAAGSLPAQLPTAHSAGLPAAGGSSQTPAATTISQGGTPLPGSAIAGLP
ncbi:hemophore [Mycolicibacterium flavescens]|uniref:Hemophore n=1 Tax=Mycolicibacterium flavescens TaxID=1776 RepID=A0A1E3R7K0_MYCFV|nr:hemophore [Mycolicibacterium flavescens]MCV7281646.1 hemophore [Mycolicibacterium flavescens]ODQ85918.1 hemophore [Mycolicibacterium flavescens]